MMWCNHFQQAVLQNERGVALLESGLHLEALTEFVEAYTSASALHQQVLSYASIDPTSFTVPPVQQIPSTRPQRLFSIISSSNDNNAEEQPTCNSPCSSTNSPTTTTNREQWADQYYIYPRGVTFNIDHERQIHQDGIVPPTPLAPTPSSNYSLLHNVTLLMGTSLFNMALCFHLRSRGRVTETVRRPCEHFALDLYRRAIDVITDTWWVAKETLANVDSVCLLVVLLNNKAVLCFEDEDYGSCRQVRFVLVLCLNILGCGVEGGVIRLEKLPIQAFLEKEDVTNLYRNGLLLEAPSVAAAA
jgi:hypothetical protein